MSFQALAVANWLFPEHTVMIHL